MAVRHSSDLAFVEHKSFCLDTIFLCSLENGMMQAYSTKQAREALAKVPAFPRVNQKIQALELLQGTAVTLDTSRR